MAKLTKRLIEEIACFIEQDTCSISEVCTVFGISRKTFYQWKGTKPDFARAMNEAMRKRDEKLLVLARQGLRSRLQGYRVYTEKVTLAPDSEIEGGYKVVKKECVTKEYGPDLKAIKYVLDKEEKRKAEAESVQEIVEISESELSMSDEERRKKALDEKYGDIMKIEDTKARHHVMYMRDRMRDGTHPQLTGKPMCPDWEEEYVGM